MNLILQFRDFMNINLSRVPMAGKELPCKREMHNLHNTFAVAVTKDHVVAFGPHSLKHCSWA